jgi:hypothetical protein
MSEKNMDKQKDNIYIYLRLCHLNGTDGAMLLKKESFKNSTGA